jgi:hypothetical protein
MKLWIACATVVEGFDDKGRCASPRLPAAKK